MSVIVVPHKGSRKNTTRSAARCGDFCRAACLPLCACFCEQSGGMTKTASPIRLKPAGQEFLFSYNYPFPAKWKNGVFIFERVRFHYIYRQIHA